MDPPIPNLSLIGFQIFGRKIEHTRGMVGEIVGQAYGYRLIEELGSGRTSRVFKALRYDKARYFEDVVVIKVLDSQISDTLMRNEMMSLRSVQSPQLAAMLAWDFDGDQPILVFEYVESISLARLFEIEQLSGQQTQEILRQIQQGLIDLAEAGVCHGDLSLDNVLVDARGGVQLIDYGLGNVLGRVGTPPYIAPEVEQGAWANSASDMYSLGVIANQLLGTEARPTELLAAIVSWQKQDPFQRKWQNIKVNPSAREQLADKTRKILAGNNGGTQPLTPNVSSESLQCGLGILPKWAVAVAMILVLLGGHIPAASNQTDLPAVIFVQTSNWIQIAINGIEKGYSPIQVDGLEADSYRISWRGPRGEGQRILTLNSGQTMVLGDSFFSEPEVHGGLVGSGNTWSPAGADGVSSRF